MFKKILYFAFCVADLYILWLTIGFTIVGLTNPKILGDGTAMFMGNYILSITCGIIFLIATPILVIAGIKLFKKKKEA